MFGYVVWVPVNDTGRLPAHKVTLRVFAETVDAIQVGTPFGSGLYRLFTDGLERDACRGVPDVLRFIDPALALPAGIPVGVGNVSAQVDVQIDPVAGWRDLELAIVLDIGPIVAQKKLDHVAVPQFEAVFAVIRGQPQIQLVIGRDEQEIQIGVGPKRADLGFEFGIVDLLRTVFRDPGRRRMRPGSRMRIGVQFGRLRDVRDRETGRRGFNLADLPRNGDYRRQEQQ